jgi:hypothetical protein
MAKVINDDSRPPDLGREASGGFPSQVYASSRGSSAFFPAVLSLPVPGRCGPALSGGGIYSESGHLPYLLPGKLPPSGSHAGGGFSCLKGRLEQIRLP